jgi:hypothetical protein
VRQTLLLETRLAEGQARRPEDPEAQSKREWAKIMAGFAAAPLPARRRDVLRTVVPDMIDTACDREPHHELGNLYERCEEIIAEELEDQEILDRPIPELIAKICRELGVEPEWRWWDPEKWDRWPYELRPEDVSPKPARDRPPPTAGLPSAPQRPPAPA